MKNLLVIISVLLLAHDVSAQSPAANNSIAGTVINAESGLPLEYATVTLFITGQQKPATGTTTDNAGYFTLAQVPAGIYDLVIENIGFTSYTKTGLALNKKDAIVDLKKIALTVQKTSLENVTITNKTRLIENKIDKMVFNAEKDVSSQGGVAADLLKKVPQVSVDADGNVQLAGNSGIRFLINGKPSAAFGSNIADVLQSIPASQIKSIEVITNPGAKYDAQGMGGIINIILKNNSNTRGYNGNISLSAGTRMENAAVNLNARKNNFGINAFFSGNKRIQVTTKTNTYRETADSGIISTLQQNNSSLFDRSGYQTGLGFDWTVKKKNNFSGNFNYNSFSSNTQGNTNQDLQPDKGGGTPDILSYLDAGNRYRNHSIDASFNYKRTFSKEDQELEAGISIENGFNHGYSHTRQFLLPEDSLFYGINAYNPAKSKETVLSIDYTHPIKEDIKWGIGAKATFYSVESSADVTSYQQPVQAYITDAFLSSNLSYRQKVYAAYTEFTLPVAKILDAKIGGRFERTQLNAYYSNAGQVALPGYNTWIPTISLSKKLGENQTLRLSFSKRIERPDYEDLNPFVNTTDPKNLVTGNPYLKPEIGYRTELGYSRDLGNLGTFMATLFYRINDNDIQPYIIYYPSYYVGDSLYSNVAVNTRSNIGQENNMGANFFADLHLTAKLNVRGNLFLFYRHTINKIDPGFNTNSFNYRTNINATYQFSNSLVSEFFGNFNSPRNEAQGKYPSFTSYTFAMRKQFRNKKASIAFTATNFLNDNLHQKTILLGPNFNAVSERIIPFRSFGINFTWKFGKLEFKKENDHNNDPAPVAPMQ